MRLAFVCLTLAAFVGCSGRTQPLCPKHIETLRYPPIASSGNVSATVTVEVTIDANGHVADAKAIRTELNAERFSGLFEGGALANIRRWTFANPTSRPQKQTITYAYIIDPTIPPDGPTTVTLDLPDRVTIVTSTRSVNAEY